jgi:hypothetical protein
MGTIIGHVKCCHVMFAGKDASSAQVIETRAGITAWNKDPFPFFTERLVPLDGNAVSGIFAGKSEKSGKPCRTNLFQANQAYACNGVSLMQLGPEGAGKNSCITAASARKLISIRRLMIP